MIFSLRPTYGRHSGTGFYRRGKFGYALRGRNRESDCGSHPKLRPEGYFRRRRHGLHRSTKSLWATPSNVTYVVSAALAENGLHLPMTLNRLSQPCRASHPKAASFIEMDIPAGLKKPPWPRSLARLLSPTRGAVDSFSEETAEPYGVRDPPQIPRGIDKPSRTRA